MTTQNTLESFAENLRQDVLALAESDDEALMLADSFSQTVFDMLSEAGEFEDPLVCYHRALGMEVSGYGVDEDEGRVDLFLSIYTNTVPPATVTRQQVTVAFRRLRQFLEWCLAGGYVQLEESSPVFDMAAHIHELGGSTTRARLCVITDGRTTVDTLPQDDRLGDVTISRHLWDAVRLHRLSMSGRREAISIDLTERFGEPLPCLLADSSEDGYRAFLTLIPGHMLRSIYADFGSRLLERNVRSFLQARGKVNRGIRDTITGDPEKFLAYNNGITMTAEGVGLSHANGASAITRLEGLQIVNGGQTTASLLAANRGRADLSQVYVAAKLIEIESGSGAGRAGSERIPLCEFPEPDLRRRFLRQRSIPRWDRGTLPHAVGASSPGVAEADQVVLRTCPWAVPGCQGLGGDPRTAEGLPGREPHETALRQNRPGKIREHLGPVPSYGQPGRPEELLRLHDQDGRAGSAGG